MGGDPAKEGTDQIFISYARVDGEKFANYLADRLDENGFPVWMDQRNIPKGADWDSEIDRALSRSAALLLVATPGAAISDQVKGEWLHALNNHTPLFPLLIADCELPRTLKVHDFVDFQNGYEQAFARLMHALEDPMRALLERLEEKVAQLQAARQATADAELVARYDHKIVELQSVIDQRTSRVKTQLARIERGLGDEKLPSPGKSAPLDAPMVRTAGRRPQDVTEFFKDRQLVREQMSQILAAGTPRIVTVIGRGGMGKTAVCCKVLRDLEQHRWQHESDSLPRLHGIAYLSTRTGGISGERLFFDSLSLLPNETQERLKKLWVRSELPLEEKFASLLEAIGDRPCVMLWDNMEDLLDDGGALTSPALASFLDVFVKTPHACRLLLNTREAIPLGADVLRHEYRVGLVDGLPEEDSIALLRELDPSGTYGLADASDEQLRRVARCTFGVPRALEIVAGILANDPFSEIDELTDDFYSHEEVVQKLAKENYRRLDEDARLVLQAIAIFARPISRNALDFLLVQFSPGINVPAVLRRLVSTHIASIDRASKLVSLHPIDREYILSQMPADGERSLQAMHRAAAEYYRSIQSVDLKDLRHVEVQHTTHLVPQFEHLCEAGEFNQAAIIFAKLSYALVWRGCGEQARQMSARLRDQPLSDPARCGFLIAEIALATILGPLEEAARIADETIDLARELNDLEAEVQALHQLITVYRYLDDSTRALAACKRARQIYEQLGDVDLTRDCIRKECLVLTYRGDLPLARQRADELLAQAHDADLEGNAHNVLSAIHQLSGDFQASIAHCRRALAAWQRPETDAFVYVLNTLGMSLFRSGEIDEAKSTFIDGRQAGDDVQSPRAAGFCLHNLTIVHCLLGEAKEAAEMHGDAQTAMDRMGLGEPTRAVGHAIDALHRGQSREQADALLQCARLSAKNPDLFGPQALLRPILQLADQAGADDLAQQAAALVADFEAKLVLPTPESTND